MFTFVTGGLRSGKSEYAIRRASEMGPPPWLWVAAYLEGDDELKARLVGHRRETTGQQDKCEKKITRRIHIVDHRGFTGPENRRSRGVGHGAFQFSVSLPTPYKGGGRRSFRGKSRKLFVWSTQNGLHDLDAEEIAGVAGVNTVGNP